MERTERAGRRQRIHPASRRSGRRRHGPAWQGRRGFLPPLLLAALVTGCGGGGDDRSTVPAGRPDAGERPVSVRPGIVTLLADSIHLVKGRRVGLITNQTGVDPNGVSSIDLLHEAPGVDLVALFSPEHGIRGEAGAGEAVGDATDARTGLPIHSLYGETRQPTPEMLEGLDLLLFDIQDIGARYYTYVSTMALAMAAAAEAGLPFVVLDRPNPIGGVHVEGAVLDEGFSSFVGLYPIPMRHGMTPGELARLFNDRHGIGAELHVAPVGGWERARWFDETGLPWIAPSPNMPNLESATHYPGSCLFEGTVLSVGRGTAAPFQQIGAPWLDGPALAERLAGYGIEGVRFEPVEFTPDAPGDGKFGGQASSGVRFVVTDRERYEPTAAAVAALIEARALAGDRWEWRAAHFDRLAGTDRLRTAIDAGGTLAEITGDWEAALEEFRALRARYLIY